MSVKSDISSCGLAAGADLFHYERINLENQVIDEVIPGSHVCFMQEVNTVNMTTDSNGISEGVTVSVSFISQANYKELASYNEDLMNELLEMCRKFMIELVKTGNYQKVISIPWVKFEETVFDANYIGWTANFNLTPRDGYTEC